MTPRWALHAVAFAAVFSTAAAQTNQEQEEAPPQEPATKEGQVPELPPVTVSAFRIQQDPFDLARSVTVVDLEHLIRRDEDSVLDALDRRIGIWIEKRTATTSDPVIRGLSGANILALVDGDSLTTFWGEGGFAGDDMYGKVEAESVERIEVIRGPASVEYGSNALGGVINFITRKPRLGFTEEGVRFGGRAKASYDTVNDGKMARLDVESALPWLRFRVGGTWRDLEDGEGGNGVGTLTPSGGDDLNFDLNSEARIGDDAGTWFFNAQRVRREDIVRYYRPTQTNENDRDAVSFGYRSSAPDAGSGFEGRFYYQDKEDRRYWQNNGDFGVAKWRTLSTDWSWHTDRLLEDHEIVAGLTVRQDEGESPDDEQFTITTPGGVTTKAAPDQEWYDFGVFVRDDWKLAPQWTLSGGIRFDRFYYDADPDAFYQPGVGDPSLDDIETWESSVTGGVGLVFAPDEAWRTYASWTRGFRMFAPRFGISKLGFGVLVPTGQLDPVTGDSFEVGVRTRNELFDTQLAFYYTVFDGFQNPVPGTFNGQQYYDYDGDGVLAPDERVYVTAGNGEAYVMGVEWEARMELHELWDAIPLGTYASGGFMWNQGQDQTNDEPLRHTHPARGLLTLGYEEPMSGRWYVDITADFVDRYTDISSSRLQSDVGYRKDPQDPTSPLIRDDGLPGYTVIDISAGARLDEKLRLGVNLENVTNKNYRPAHSRMDAFGFNFNIWLEGTF